MDLSIVAKTVAARTFCSSFILYIVGLEHSSQIISPYYLGSIQAVLLADAIINPTLRLLDVAGTFRRYVLAPYAETDEAAKHLCQGTDWFLSERYTDMIKSMLMSFFYSALFPLGFFYTAASMFYAFWVDKYLLLRIYKNKPPTGAKLSNLTRVFTAIIVLIHCIITAHYYHGWPFDNLCPSPDTLSEDGTSFFCFSEAKRIRFHVNKLPSYS